MRWEGQPIVVAANCPVCSSTMVLRTARQGRIAGNQFWGCSRYPDCRATRPVSNGGVRRRRYVSFSPRFRRQMRRIGVLIFAIVLAATVSYFTSGPHVTSSPRNVGSHEAPVPRNSSFLIDVIDGDTVRSSGKVYRLVGFNTPESGTNARDVGSILIAEGLAEKYVCGITSCPPRRNWCGH